MITLPKLVGPLVGLAADKDGGRPGMRGVNLQSNGTIVKIAATDGYALGIVQLETEPPGGEEAITIPTEQWENIFKIANMTKIVGADCEVIMDNEADNCSLIVAEHRIPFVPVEGLFPAYMQVLPDGAPLIRVRLDAKILLRALQVAIAVCPDPGGDGTKGGHKAKGGAVPIELLWWGKDRPIGIMTKQPGSHTLDIIVMPLT